MIKIIIINKDKKVKQAQYSYISSNIFIKNPNSRPVVNRKYHNEIEN